MESDTCHQCRSHACSDGDQAQRPDIVFYSIAFVNILIARRLLFVQDSNNTVRLSSAALMLFDVEGIDKELDKELERVEKAGVGDAGRNILRLVSLKLARQTSSVQNPETQSSVLNESNNFTQYPEKNELVDAINQAKDNSISVMPSSKRRRVDGNFDIADRDLTTLHSKDKLNMIRRIEAQCQGHKVNTFTSSLRTMYYSVVIPVLKCLREHCGDDDDKIFETMRRQFFAHRLEKTTLSWLLQTDDVDTTKPRGKVCLPIFE